MVRQDQTSDVQLHIGESLDSGFDAEPVIGPRFARTRWHRPGMTVSGSLRRLRHFSTAARMKPTGRMHVITTRKKIIYLREMMLHKPNVDVRDQAVATPVRIVALDRARTVITLLVVLHHSVINYTHFGHGDRMRWLGFDLVVLFN